MEYHKEVFWTPLLFLKYINDLPKECENLSDISLFAEDAELYKLLNSKNDKMMLQQALNNFKSWEHKWLLNLNIVKCIVISIRKDLVNIILKHQLVTNYYNV